MVTSNKAARRSYGSLNNIGIIFLLMACLATLQIGFNGIQNKQLISCSVSVNDTDTPRTGNQLKLSSTSLAYEQSLGFFDDIPDQDWEMRQSRARAHRHHNGNPLRYWSGKHSASMYFNFHYEPLFSCPHLMRVGGPGDGPKWTCDVHRIQNVVRRRNSTCLVYSIGSAGIYIWEDSLFDLLGPEVCEFHIFDPGNYDRPELNRHRNFHYHPWGFKSSYQVDTPSELYGNLSRQNLTFMSFPETLRTLGHENRIIDLFKVDCESCEWFSYKDWIQYGDIRQIMVETHHLPRPKPSERSWPWPATNITPTDFFDDLQNAGFIMFSKETNNHYLAKVSLKAMY